MGEGSEVRSKREVSSHHFLGDPGGSERETPLLSSPHITVTAELGPSCWLLISSTTHPERKERLKKLRVGQGAFLKGEGKCCSLLRAQRIPDQPKKAFPL